MAASSLLSGLWIRRIALLIACVWAFSSIGSIAVAGSGGVSTLPLTGKLNKSGVRMVVDTRWIDAHGYRPVQIEIIPLKSPAPADRQFRVVLRPQSYYGSGRDTISQIIELEQGSLKAVARIPVPQDAGWYAMVVEVYEDGRLHDDLSGDHLAWPGGNSWNWNETTPGVLVIDSKAPSRTDREMILQTMQAKGQKSAEAIYNERLPDIRNLVRRFPDNQFAGVTVNLNESKATPAVQLLNEMKDTVKGEILPPSELPERWIELSGFDLTIISLADLAALATSKPGTLRALADWNRAGQTLIIYDTGEDFSGLAQLEKLLQLRPLPNAEQEEFRGWRPPRKSERGQPLRAIINNNGQYPGAYAQASPGTSTAPELSLTMPGDAAVNQPWAFVVRDAGLGQVAAFDRNPFPGTSTDWDWLLNSLRGDAWSPAHRTGISMQQRNEDFWNFSIPGVGQAPVLSFLVFITLFVAVIGPVNYYLLQRRQRLYMLLITVPAGAFVVTLSLFLYAMFTDGIGVKSRVRSYTHLDQRTGNAASTSRQAYYASIAPSQGFSYQDDTIIIPFLHEPMTRSGQRAVRRQIHWDDEEQQLRGGYLASRTLSQLLVTKSGSTKAALRIGKVLSGKLSVTNELDATLGYLLVMDEDGQYYRGIHIKPGAAQLTPVGATEAARELGIRLNEYRPEFPEGYDPSMHDSPLDMWAFGPRYYNRWGNNQTSQASSLLEHHLARFAHLASQPLERRSYVALADNSPVVPIGAKTRQYRSLHVIEGQY